MAKRQPHTSIEQFVADGWHVKLMSDHNGPKPVWRVWVRWPKGPLPHKEESNRCDSLVDAVAWISQIIEAWDFE